MKQTGLVDIGFMVAGIDEFDDSDAYKISGEDDFDHLMGAAAKAKSGKSMLNTLANTRLTANAQRSLGNKAVVANRLKQVSRQVLAQTGKLEADYLRRPNTMVAVYGPNIAPGGTDDFRIVPGSGNSFYRILNLIATDSQVEAFGFSNFTVGGENHVKMQQSDPTPPVANAVPWAPYALRESALIANIAPWTGQVFDNSTPVSGTIVNMTTAGGADSATLAPRFVISTQTDPCGYRYTQLNENSKGMWKSMRRNIGAYAPMLAFG